MNAFTDLERRRTILEELEVIEHAVTDRLRRNPEIFYRYNDIMKVLGQQLTIPAKSDVLENRIYQHKRTKRSLKQIKSQEFEISLFLGKYRKLLKELHYKQNIDFEKNKETELDLEKFEDVVREISEKDDASFRSLTALKHDYEQFSNSNDNEVDLLSSHGQAIDITKIFSREELFGKYMNLTKYYELWLNMTKSAELDFLAFLRVLEAFQTDQFLLHPVMNRHSKNYYQFLKEILKYYKSFFGRCYPLVDKENMESTLHNGFDKYLLRSDLNTSRPGKYYCAVCEKWFKTLSVFEHHFTGNRHVANLERKKKLLFTEYSLHCYSRYLDREISNTRSLVERKLAFTNDELKEELEKMQNDFEAPVYLADEKEDTFANLIPEEQSDDDTDPTNPYNLPLGPDGFPIPHWLYKLQGLNMEYVCEICGNSTYRGRREFEKHFNSTKHTEGLRSLGIEPSPSFKDISKIAEAQELWNKLQSHSTNLSTGANNRQADMVLEVEDDEGNVMSVKVYEELKKQGLL